MVDSKQKLLDSITKLILNYEEIPGFNRSYAIGADITFRDGIRSDLVFRFNGEVFVNVKDKPFERKLIADGFKYNFLNRSEKCPCGSEMMGRIKSYPPYCDSTYEEWVCPTCNKGHSMSA